MQAAQGNVQRLARRQRCLPKGHLFGFDAQPSAAPCGRIAAFSGLLQIGDDLPLCRGKIRRQRPHAVQPNAVDGGLAPRFAGIIDRVVVQLHLHLRQQALPSRCRAGWLARLGAWQVGAQVLPCYALYAGAGQIGKQAIHAHMAGIGWQHGVGRAMQAACRQQGRQGLP